jgi:hypothetical protein
MVTVLLCTARTNLSRPNTGIVFPRAIGVPLRTSYPMNNFVAVATISRTFQVVDMGFGEAGVQQVCLEVDRGVFSLVAVELGLHPSGSRDHDVPTIV